MSHWTVSRTAAKQHICTWCETAIESGKQHLYHRGALWGDFYTYRTHTECDEAIWRDPHHQFSEYELCQDPHRRGMTCEETEMAVHS